MSPHEPHCRCVSALLTPKGVTSGTAQCPQRKDPERCESNKTSGGVTLQQTADKEREKEIKNSKVEKASWARYSVAVWAKATHPSLFTQEAAVGCPRKGGGHGHVPVSALTSQSVKKMVSKCCTFPLLTKQ